MATEFEVSGAIKLTLYRIAYHSSNCEVWTSRIFTAILKNIVKGVYSGRYKVSGFKFAKVLWYGLNARIVNLHKSRTSCHSHKSTEPGSSRPFLHAAELVKSRHRASTILPFFSFDT